MDPLGRVVWLDPSVLLLPFPTLRMELVENLGVPKELEDFGELRTGWLLPLIPRLEFGLLCSGGTGELTNLARRTLGDPTELELAEVAPPLLFNALIKTLRVVISSVLRRVLARSL